MKLEQLQEAKYYRPLDKRQVLKAYRAIYKKLNDKDDENDVGIDPTIHPSFEKDFCELDLLVRANSEEDAKNKIENWAHQYNLPYTGIAHPDLGADAPYYTSAIGYEY